MAEDLALLGAELLTLQRLAEDARERIPPKPYAKSGERLVKDAEGVGGLNGIVELVSPYSASLAADLHEIREHRNHIAHGGRLGKVSRFQKLDEVQATLTEALELIAGG